MAGDPTDFLAPDVTPTGVNQPRRPYGDRVALDNLAKAMPAVAGSAPEASMPAPEAGSARPGPPGATTPPPGLGVPPVVTSHPGSGFAGPQAPLSPAGAATAAVTEAQRRLAVLDQLARSPKVSEATRELAERILKLVVG